MKSRFAAPTVLLLAGSACAVRLGGGGPEPYQTLAVPAGASASAEDVASRIRSVAGQLVLLTADRDSAWFADIAERTGLALSGPGRTGSRSMAFLTDGLTLLGDTSLVLGLASGGVMHMHDALYEIGKDRLIDLMLIDLEAVTDLRDGVRTLLSYIATDVGNNVPLILAVQAPTPQVGDSAAVLLRAAFGNAAECAARDGKSAAEPARMNLFYYPSVRLTCQSAGLLPGDETAISARLVVGR
jgi:hypothetical protein